MNVSLTSAHASNLAASVWERPASSPAATAESAPSAETGDMVSVRPQARLLDDSEVDGVLAETMDAISSDPYSALHAHSGLDASRVAALLA